jgi:rhamnogalacturonan endolyase
VKAVIRPVDLGEVIATDAVFRYQTSPVLKRRSVSYLVALLWLGGAGWAAEPVPASVAERNGLIRMENGRVALVLAKSSGKVVSLKLRRDSGEVELGNGREAMYFDANGGPATVPLDIESDRPRKDSAHPLTGGDVQILRRGSDMVEVALTGKPSLWFPFGTEVHYVLPRGASGFYVYAIYRHGPGLPAANLGQARFVIKGVPGARLFTHHVVDAARNGPFPTAPITATVQDATFRLADGTVYTKYDNAAFAAEDFVHGMAGHGVGLWMIYPSHEFISGGPIKQNLTVHMDNVVLGMLACGHFGSGSLAFRAGEPWTKLYGPLLVYLNEGPTVTAMWADAQQRAAAERAQWPYAWLDTADYPRERGTVTGRVQLTGGGSAAGAWAVLTASGADWTQLGKGYNFWTLLDAAGRFTLPQVRPGRYTLFVSGANQFEDYRHENVVVTAGTTTDLGDLQWQPIRHGRALWQIGLADRSSHEFKGGDNYRHYGNFLRYPREFPADVTFVIGQSREQEDWNFAQWNWYSQKPVWTIRFDLAEAPTGQAMLTVGLASVLPPHGRTTNLKIAVNGRDVSVLHLAKSGPAAYRSGCQDSAYNVAYVPFDAGLLRAGTNEVTFGHAEAMSFAAPESQRRRAFGAVMYDAIRLEVAAAPVAPPTK